MRADTIFSLKNTHRHNKYNDIPHNIASAGCGGISPNAPQVRPVNDRLKVRFYMEKQPLSSEIQQTNIELLMVDKWMHLLIGIDQALLR